MKPEIEKLLADLNTAIEEATKKPPQAEATSVVPPPSTPMETPPVVAVAGEPCIHQDTKEYIIAAINLIPICGK